MNKSLVDVLTQARDSLTPENWDRQEYFQLKSGRLCMCAHGAVQALVNPSCQQKIQELIADQAIKPQTRRFVDLDVGQAAAAIAIDAERHMQNPYADIYKIWDNRPAVCKYSYDVESLCRYGNYDAHYLLGMVGLTSVFNDNHLNTLDDIKIKFNKAIELAKQLGV